MAERADSVVSNADRPRLRTIGIALSLFLAAPLAGCYRFTPAEVTSLNPGTSVRLRLTDDGSAAMAVSVGPRMESMDGILAEFAGDSAVVLRLQQTTSRGGAVTEWNGESVSVPRRAIAAAQRKSQSPRRTALVAAGSVAAIVAITAGINLIGSRNGGRTMQGGTPK